jgi:hypothetical protein
MDLWLFVGSVLLGIGIAVGTLAHRNDEKWAIFLRHIVSAGAALFIAAVAVGALANFIYFSGDHSEVALAILNVAGALATGIAGAVGLALVADWIRR